MKMTGIILVFVFAFAFCACSVKEWRGGCPADLLVMAGDVNGDCGDSTDVFLTCWAGCRFGHTKVTVDSLSEDGVRFSAPRCLELYATTLTGVSTARMEKNVAYVSEECDSLYGGAVRFEIAASEEQKTVIVPIRKQFCTVTVRVRGIRDGQYPYSFSLVGNTDGIDYGTCSPHTGHCEIRMRRPDIDRYVARIPRQADGSLLLRITREDGSIYADIPVSSLVSGGFSWISDNLGDIDIILDFASNTGVVNVLGWEVGFIIKYTL